MVGLKDFREELELELDHQRGMTDELRKKGDWKYKCFSKCIKHCNAKLIFEISCFSFLATLTQGI